MQTQSPSSSQSDPDADAQKHAFATLTDEDNPAPTLLFTKESNAHSVPSAAPNTNVRIDAKVGNHEFSDIWCRQWHPPLMSLMTL